MRKPLLSILFVIPFLHAMAQAPPRLEWHKCLGGFETDAANSIDHTPDGGYIMAGHSKSVDGDLTFNHGLEDAWVIKTDAAGNIQWQKSYGGTYNEFVTMIIATADGGYIFTGATSSNDGDVSGNHGGIRDAWVVKLDAVGNIQWQKCYGGPGLETASVIQQTSDGGYIVGAQAGQNGGDVTGHHGVINANDVWILKLDGAGNIQWQKCYGGTKPDDATKIIQANDGGYLVVASVESTDGDVSCRMRSLEDLWVLKLDNAGNIQWQFCLGGNYGEAAYSLIQTMDGGYVIAGATFSDDLPGSYGLGGDAWIIKIDGTGNIQWQRIIGGTQRDEFRSIKQTADGGYIAAGNTSSTDGDICSIEGIDDLFVVKLNSDGTTAWQKTYGGSNRDIAGGILLTSDGGYMVAGYTLSNDRGASGNHNPGIADAWMVKLLFPGTPIVPSINISASETIICPGGNVTFTSSITNGGSSPSYQWQLNGVDIPGVQGSTMTIGIPGNGGTVNCIITNSSPCVTMPTAISNTITITADPSITPAGFLPSDTEICSYGKLKLEPAGVYTNFLWNNNDTTPTLTITDPGTYWLQVTTDKGCRGSDTILVTPKDCLKGFYMPTAFTPNQDGKNDILKPILGGDIKQYKLSIYNRWGQVVFQTTDPEKGWNGDMRGAAQDNGVFVWVCVYQFEGEDIKTARGTVTLIR